MQKRIITTKQQKALIVKSQLGMVAHTLLVLKITKRKDRKDVD